MTISHDHVDGNGRIRIVVEVQNTVLVSLVMTVEDADALAKSLIDEGIVWRAHKEADR